jgi:hypothetical protein
MRISFQLGFGVFKDLHSKLPTHGRKVFKENFQWVSGLEVFKQDSYGDPRSDEHRSTSEDLGIRDDTR